MRQSNCFILRVVVYRLRHANMPWEARCLEADLVGQGRTSEQAERECIGALLRVVNDGHKRGESNALGRLGAAPDGFRRLLCPGSHRRVSIDPDSEDRNGPRWVEVNSVPGSCVDPTLSHVEVPQVWDGQTGKPVEIARYDLSTGRRITAHS